MAKCNTFVTIKKILGKTHLSKPYKQGLPEGQGRNGCSPFKGIDTLINASYEIHYNRRNGCSPFKGIDTQKLGNYKHSLYLVEMDVARLRALTPFKLYGAVFYENGVEMDEAR